MLHTLAVDASSYRNAPKNGFQQLVRYTPSVFSTKTVQVVSRMQSRSKRSSFGSSPENFLAFGGYFEHNTYCVVWLNLKKKGKIRRR